MNAPVARSSTSKDTFRRGRRPSHRAIFICGILAFGAIAIIVVTWYVFGTARGGSDKHLNVHKSTRSPLSAIVSDVPVSTTAKNVDGSTAEPASLVDDDGRTLWASPTRGEPLSLAFLPPGVQIIVAMRPEALAGHPEGEKVLASLGPLGQRGREILNEMLLEPRGVKELAVGLNRTSGDRWQSVSVARLSSDLSAAEHLQARLPEAVRKAHAGTEYLVANDWAYYAPDEDSGLLIVGPEMLIAEIIELNGEPPPIRRDVGRLLAHSDADRQLTIMVAPSFLYSEDRGIFSGQLAPLHPPLFWFLGDEFSAAALSMHWDDDNFFIELSAAPTLDTSPERAARVLSERVAQIPDRLEEYVVGLDPHPYGRRVIARFPAMVRKLTAYTRSGFDKTHVTLRCYLPAIAGHNLLMGVELTLAESLRSSRSPVSSDETKSIVAEATAPSSADSAVSIGERLQRITSLAFARDTLDAALELLSRDLGVEIVINGADLQAEGITKNQSFGIDLADRPAEEILIEVLRLANPDKTAPGPSDPRQKLVYVISAAGDGRSERIVVTTRAAAATRSEQLPAVFEGK